jgi:hypothetical protein
MKMMLGVVLLACVPAAVAEIHYSYPTEKLAEFVVEKLDVASVPPAIRPKLAHGKTTFVDYGYITQKLAARQFPDCDQHLGGESIWNLRLFEWPRKKPKRQPCPTSAAAESEKCGRRSKGPGSLEGIRCLSSDWQRHRLVQRRLVCRTTQWLAAGTANSSGGRHFRITAPCAPSVEAIADRIARPSGRAPTSVESELLLL